jgi:mannose-6-phosphate isomerase-like protein (cupin superfamily)
MKAHDIRATLKDLPLLTITASTTEEDAIAAERKLASFNQCMVGLVRYWGQPPWERHPGGDELLHILEGEVDVIVLTDGGPVHEIARAGSVCIVPQGLWHRTHARAAVTLLYMTPAEGNEHSFAEVPRRAG